MHNCIVYRLLKNSMRKVNFEILRKKLNFFTESFPRVVNKNVMIVTITHLNENFFKICLSNFRN